jgi:hypothetical protein
MWVGENESAKFWATVLNGLKNRGVEDIFIACTDNLTVTVKSPSALHPMGKHDTITEEPHSAGDSSVVLCSTSDYERLHGSESI